MLRLHLLVFLNLCFILSFAQTPCDGVQANGFPCSQVNLQSQLPLNAIGGGSIGNDIWGWTDPMTNREYAIMGRSSGTSFIDITDAVNPVYLGNLPTQTSNSSWRDVKVVNDYAYIVSEAGGHGMQVFDLTRLRNVVSPPATFTVDNHISAFGNAHNIVGSEEAGFVYPVGAGACSGGLVAYDVSDPGNPNFEGCYDMDGYSHDAICFIYKGCDAEHIGKEICIGFNEDTNTIVDMTDKSDPTMLSRTGYPGRRYTHQGWVTDDHRYLLVDDELDEQNNGHNTRTYIFDISDLDDPVQIGTYTSAIGAIDHNLYIRGRYAFQANYQGGLRILDLVDVANANITEVAHFDIFPSSNGAQFNGSWSNYPYFKSGNVIISGIDEGLFVVQPDFPHYSFSLESASVIELNAGGVAQTFEVDLTAYGGYTDMVDLEIEAPDDLMVELSDTQVPSDGMVTVTVRARSCAITANHCILLKGNQSDIDSKDHISLGVKVTETPVQVAVAAKAILSGPYTGSSMFDALRIQELIPLTEPYGGSIENLGIKTTTTVLASNHSNNAIVDWVIVELRSDQTTVAATKAALVQRDGDIVDVDGECPVAFPGLTAGDYYVVIKHRNHLSVMTADPMRFD